MHFLNEVKTDRNRQVFEKIGCYTNSYYFFEFLNQDFVMAQI